MLRVPSAGAEFGECTPKAGIELGVNGNIFPTRRGSRVSQIKQRRPKAEGGIRRGSGHDGEMAFYC